jgi:hypothetical protein
MNMIYSNSLRRNSRFSPYSVEVLLVWVFGIYALSIDNMRRLMAVFLLCIDFFGGEKY